MTKTLATVPGDAQVPNVDHVMNPTEKQTNFLRTLLAERQGIETAENIRTQLNVLREAGRLDKQHASAFISQLMAIKVPKAGGNNAGGCTGMAPFEQAQEGDLLFVPEGHYATASRTGSNDLDFWRVDRPAEGRWAGRVFIKRVIGGQADTPVRGAEAVEALTAITRDHPSEAMALYGQEIGRCGRCNRHLTDEVSRQHGIGPECRKHL